MTFNLSKLLIGAIYGSIEKLSGNLRLICPSGVLWNEDTMGGNSLKHFQTEKRIVEISWGEISFRISTV